MHLMEMWSLLISLSTLSLSDSMDLIWCCSSCILSSYWDFIIQKFFWALSSSSTSCCLRLISTKAKKHQLNQQMYTSCITWGKLSNWRCQTFCLFLWITIIRWDAMSESVLSIFTPVITRILENWPIMTVTDLEHTLNYLIATISFGKALTRKLTDMWSTYISQILMNIRNIYTYTGSGMATAHFVLSTCFSLWAAFAWRSSAESYKNFLTSTWKLEKLQP